MLSGSNGGIVGPGGAARHVDRVGAFERLLFERARPILARADAGEDVVSRAGSRARRAGPGGRRRPARGRGARRGVGVVPRRRPRRAAARVGGAAVRGDQPVARGRRPTRRRRPPAARRRRARSSSSRPALAAMHGPVPTLGATPPLELVAGRELAPDVLAERLVDLGYRARRRDRAPRRVRRPRRRRRRLPRRRAAARSASSTGATRSSRSASSRPSTQLSTEPVVRVAGPAGPRADPRRRDPRARGRRSRRSCTPTGSATCSSGSPTACTSRAWRRWRRCSSTTCRRPPSCCRTGPGWC